MDYKKLIKHCTRLMDSHKSNSVALEAHLNEYLKNNPELAGDAKVFVVEVYSGCARYPKILATLMNGFYNKVGTSVLRSEESLYRVIAYLALFRLGEMGLPLFKDIVKSQHINKMARFLGFFFDERNLITWVKDEWNKIYDESWVDNTLLKPLKKYLPDLEKFVEKLKSQLDYINKYRVTSVPITEPEPFNLTQPKPRAIPMPQPIPKLAKHKPVPKSIFKDPKEIDTLTRIRETNRRKAEERLMEASKLQFACANPEKSDKTKEKLKMLQEVEDAKLEFNKSKANPLPKSILSDNIPIKLNAATILREAQHYQKLEDDEVKRLERLEAGHRDASEFKEWQSKMKRKDLENQLEEIERRRLEGKLSYEDAIAARQNLITENRKKVEAMKEEARRLMQSYLERKLEEEQEMKKLVEGVVDTHTNAKEAKKKLQEYKSKIVQQMNEESKEMMRLALEEAEKEMKQKMELIQQIRAMEATPVNRNKLVDFGTVPGYGFLGEMSILELKERLAFLKINEREELDEKRDKIMESKQAKDQYLMDTIESIAKHRAEQNRVAARKFERKKKEYNEKIEIKNEKLTELERKLEERRAQRKQDRESAKSVPDRKLGKKMASLHTNNKTLENKRWEEIEKRQERTAKLASGTMPMSKSASRIAGGRIMLSTAT